MTLTRQAALIAAHAHRNQTYGGDTYFDAHLMLVAENAHLIAVQAKWSEKDRHNAEAIAFLHDVYEDKHMGISAIQRDLSLATDSPNATWIGQAVKHLSRRKGERPLKSSSEAALS